MELTMRLSRNVIRGFWKSARDSLSTPSPSQLIRYDRMDFFLDDGISPLLRYLKFLPSCSLDAFNEYSDLTDSREASSFLWPRSLVQLVKYAMKTHHRSVFYAPRMHVIRMTVVLMQPHPILVEESLKQNAAVWRLVTFVILHYQHRALSVQTSSR